MKSRSIRRQKKPESLLDQIKQYLEENFRKKITLDDIADTLHVNRSYLSRYYKNKTGVNLFDEILIKRVEKAERISAEYRDEDL